MRLIFILFLFLATPSFAEPYEIHDPLEGFNRRMHWFNEKFDGYLLEPVAKGYDSVTPNFVQDRVENFFDNLAIPSYFLSSMLQAKFTQSSEELARFIINSTIGLLGLFDVAVEMGLPEHKEDFALAFTEWGIPAGPYIVVPFVGPTTVRDGVGLIFDAVTNPLYWTGTLFNTDSKTTTLISVGSTALDVIDTRAGLIDAIDTAKESSLDYYLFMQSSYYQYREGLYFDGDVPEEEDEAWLDE